MKKRWATRISEIEQSIKPFRAKLLFEEWIKKNGTAPNQDHLKLLDIVPEELRLPCLFHALAKIKENHASKSLST